MFRLTKFGLYRYGAIDRAALFVLIFGLGIFSYANSALSSPQYGPMKTSRLCSPMVEYNGEMYFCYDHPRFGRELHRTNGEQYDTRMVIDIDPGPGSSSPDALFVWKNELYFVAENTPTGTSLWKTDGTATGTRRIKSLPNLAHPGLQIEQIAKSDQMVAFLTPSKIGDVVIATDGSAAGTFEHSSLLSVAVKNQKIYAVEQIDRGWNASLNELRPDGSLVKLWETSVPTAMCYFNIINEFEQTNRVLFSYYDGCSYGRDIYVAVDIDTGVAEFLEPLRYAYLGAKGTDQVYFLNRELNEVVKTDNFIDFEVIPRLETPKRSSLLALRSDKVFYPLGGISRNVAVVDTKDSVTYVANVDDSLLLEGYRSLSEQDRAKNVRADGSFVGLGVGAQKKSVVFSNGSAGNLTVVKEYNGAFLKTLGYVASGSKLYFVEATDNEFTGHLDVSDGTVSGTRRLNLGLAGQIRNIERLGSEGDRFYFATFLNDDGIVQSPVANTAMWHTKGSASTTYMLYLSDDYRAPVTYLPPIIDLLID